MSAESPAEQSEPAESTPAPEPAPIAARADPAPHANGHDPCATCAACHQPLERPRYPGRKTRMADGRYYVIPPLHLGQMRRYQEQITRLRSVATVDMADDQAFEDMLDLMWTVLRRNYPTLTVVDEEERDEQGQPLVLHGRAACKLLLDGQVVREFGPTIWALPGFEVPEGEAGRA